MGCRCFLVAGRWVIDVSVGDATVIGAVGIILGSSVGYIFNEQKAFGIAIMRFGAGCFCRNIE